jgi:hypothetical protein
MNTKLNKSLIAAVVTAVTAFSVSAAWDTPGAYGKNVTWFDSANPEKIIFIDQVYSNATIQAYATERTPFNNYNNISKSTEMWHVTPDANFKPGGRIDAKVGGMYHTPISLHSNTVVNFVNKGQVTECTPGDKTCPSVTKITGSNTCTFATVKTTLSGEIGTGGEVAAPVYGTGAQAAANFGFTKEWTKGWQSCQTEQEAHTCHGGSFLSFPSKGYPTSEARSKFGSYQFRPAGTKFWFAAHNSDTDQAYCRDKLGGFYQTGSPGNGGTCSSLDAKPTWKRFEKLPIEQTETVSQLVGRCRYIKA